MIPIEYDRALPFICVRRPTPEELDKCERRLLTLTNNWNPASFNLSNISATSSKLYITSDDPTNDLLQCKYLGNALQLTQQLFEQSGSQIYATSFSPKSAITPEKLSKLWFIGLKTAERTLKATTYKCTRTTGLLSKRFKTDKSHL